MTNHNKTHNRVKTKNREITKTKNKENTKIKRLVENNNLGIMKIVKKLRMTKRVTIGR